MGKKNMWVYPPSRIVVPVDFGGASSRAAVVAGVLARRFGAHLEAFHAETLEAPPYFTHEQMGSLERQRTSARMAAERYLAGFVESSAGVPMSATVVEGPPEAAIIEAGRAADLIVMGTHGRKGPSRWWLGSVAERVVRGTSVPVLVVREHRDGTAPFASAAGTGHAAEERIFAHPLVVVGPDAFEGQATRYAHGLAGAFGGTLPPVAEACDVSLATDREATMMVIPAKTGGSYWLGESTERLLRGCTLPMLFVPSA
jgi:nucleotide-binding universal stress UspA family protein